MTLPSVAALLQQGRFADAEALLARLPPAVAAGPEACFYAAIAAASLGRSDDARAAFDAALAGAPNSLPILSARASFLASIGDTAAALAAWQQVT